MLAIFCALAAARTNPADLVIVHARIWSDGQVGFAESAAVENGRFVYVGKPDPARIGPKTQIVDAKGRVVIPGLIDSHIHMVEGGMGLTKLDLRDAKDRDDFVRRVREWSAKLDPQAWVEGRGWSVESWPVQDPPRKDWIDAATGGRPALLVRMDGHSGLANSAALKLAGIDKNGPPNPPGGVIDRDADGEPTGVLRENALGLVASKVPAESKADRAAGLQAAIRHANANGITAVADITGLQDLDLYANLKPSSMRFYLYLFSPTWGPALAAAKKFKPEPGWVQVRGFKAYMDGSLGSHTAYMHEPYAYNPPDKAADYRGLAMPGALLGTYAKDFKAASEAGYQAIVHAIGDEGNHLLLDLLEKNYAGLATARCRSEHAQHLLPSDIPRFANLGVIASMQPFHKADDGRYAEKHIGAERCHSSYAYKWLLDAGVVLAFGSDWPVVTLNPFLGMEAAVTGKILTGVVWEPQNNIPVTEALRAYTSSAAYAMFAEKEIGRIAPGLRADFLVLNRSPFDSGVDWSQIKPDLVYVEGRKAVP